MYFLLEKVDFQPAMLVYRRVDTLQIILEVDNISFRRPLRTLGPWNDERCVQNVRPKRMLEKRIREMYLCYMYVFHMYWLVVMCKNPSTLYLILGKRIGDSVSGGIGDSVSVFSSMAALFAWQLPVFDRGKSHVLKDARLRRNIFIFIGPWSARLPTGIGAAWAWRGTWIYFHATLTLHNLRNLWSRLRRTPPLNQLRNMPFWAPPPFLQRCLRSLVAFQTLFLKLGKRIRCFQYSFFATLHDSVLVYQRSPEPFL